MNPQNGGRHGQVVAIQRWYQLRFDSTRSSACKVLYNHVLDGRIIFYRNFVITKPQIVTFFQILTTRTNSDSVEDESRKCFRPIAISRKFTGFAFSGMSNGFFTSSFFKLCIHNILSICVYFK
jgi:hypothetical protein